MKRTPIVVFGGLALGASLAIASTIAVLNHERARTSEAADTALQKSIGAARSTFHVAGTTVAARGSAAAPAPASIPATPASAVEAAADGSSFVDAPFVSTSEFFGALKEVDLHPLQQIGGTLGRYLPVERIGSITENELARYGIRTRDGAPVVLDVVVGDEEYSNSGGDRRVHGLTVQFRFLVPAVAFRNIEMVAVIASPATSLTGVTIEEDNAVRKAFLGDHTRDDFEKRFTSLARDAFDGFARAQQAPTPWPVSRLTDPSLKRTLQEVFESKIRGIDISRSTRATPTQFKGLDAVPKLTLRPSMAGPACRVDEATWRSVLNDSFRRHGLIRETDPAELTLTHTFGCEYESGNTTYYQIVDVLMLIEANVAYVLNGRTVRGWATINSSVRTSIASESDIGDVMTGYLSKRAADLMPTP